MGSPGVESSTESTRLGPRETRLPNPKPAPRPARRGYLLGSLAVDAERHRTERHDVQHAAHDAEVLHELVELVAVLGCVHRPEVVIQQRYRNEPQQERERRPARLPTQNQHEAARDLDDDGDDQRGLGERYALGGDAGGYLRKPADLLVAGKEEEECKQDAPNEGTDLPQHFTPLPCRRNGAL